MSTDSAPSLTLPPLPEVPAIQALPALLPQLISGQVSELFKDLLPTPATILEGTAAYPSKDGPIPPWNSLLELRHQQDVALLLDASEPAVTANGVAGECWQKEVRSRAEKVVERVAVRWQALYLLHFARLTYIIRRVAQESISVADLVDKIVTDARAERSRTSNAARMGDLWPFALPLPPYGPRIVLCPIPATLALHRSSPPASHFVARLRSDDPWPVPTASPMDTYQPCSPAEDAGALTDPFEPTPPTLTELRQRKLRD
ncbi:hypothetical protein JCM10213_004626 [Rhodosporidiobolus nylandii]